METAACAPCPALPAPVTLLPRPAPQAQPDGSFVYREADALKFQEYYDGLGEECPLVPTRTRMKRNIGSPSSSCSADTLAMATWNGWGARRPDPPLAMALCSRSVRGGLRTCRKAAWRAALVFSR